MSFPESDYETIYTTMEPHVIAQLEDLMRDNEVDFRVHGSRNASSIDLAPVAVRIHLQVVHGHVDRAKELVDAFFSPIDPNQDDLPDELKPEPAEDA
ncbi:MAG: hypothetical protein EP329_18230 [Deltaproteobacteria bacterium]|nr:MAG: hypothetical protein EP329_18230 [Deltaproteobacteria bacterium]